jgi:subtilase family serine protease
VENIGEGYAGASRLFIFAFSTRRVLEMKVPPINAGSSSCGDVLFTAADVKDGIKFTVDSDQVIKETNENNNTFTSPGKSP